MCSTAFIEDLARYDQELAYLGRTTMQRLAAQSTQRSVRPPKGWAAPRGVGG